MMTRETLLRVLAALMCYRDTHVMRFLLPRKMKRHYWPMWRQLQLSAITRIMLDQVAKVFENNRRFANAFSSGLKIGDTIKCRIPARFSAQ